MRRLVLASLFSAFAAAVACSNGDAAPDQPDAAPDAGGDAAITFIDDASADHEVLLDAAPHPCTPQGWCKVPVSDETNFFAVWEAEAGDAWAVGQCGPNVATGWDDGHLVGPPAKACIEHWDGTAWQVAYSNAIDGRSNVFTTIWGSGPTDIWAGGETGVVHGHGTTPSTMTWTAVTLTRTPDNGQPIAVSSIWGSGPDDVWITGGTLNGALTDGTATVWHSQGGDADETFAVDAVTASFANARDVGEMHVFGTSANDVWITGFAGTPPNPVFMHREAAGWVDRSPLEGVPAHVTAGFGVSPSVAWMGVVFEDDSVRSFPFRETVEADGGLTVLKSDEYLDSYAETLSNGAKSFRAAYENAFWGTAPGDMWMAADLGHVRHFDGTSWRIADISGEPVPIVTNLRGMSGAGAAMPGDLWVVGERIALHHTGTGVP